MRPLLCADGVYRLSCADEVTRLAEPQAWSTPVVVAAAVIPILALLLSYWCSVPKLANVRKARVASRQLRNGLVLLVRGISARNLGARAEKIERLATSGEGGGSDASRAAAAALRRAVTAGAAVEHYSTSHGDDGAHEGRHVAKAATEAFGTAVRACARLAGLAGDSKSLSILRQLPGAFAEDAVKGFTMPQVQHMHVWAEVGHALEDFFHASSVAAARSHPRIEDSDTVSSPSHGPAVAQLPAPGGSASALDLSPPAADHRVVATSGSEPQACRAGAALLDALARAGIDVADGDLQELAVLYETTRAFTGSEALARRGVAERWREIVRHSFGRRRKQDDAGAMVATEARRMAEALCRSVDDLARQTQALSRAAVEISAGERFRRLVETRAMHAEERRWLGLTLPLLCLGAFGLALLYSATPLGTLVDMVVRSSRCAEEEGIPGRLTSWAPSWLLRWSGVASLACTARRLVVGGAVLIVLLVAALQGPSSVSNVLGVVACAAALPALARGGLPLTAAAALAPALSLASLAAIHYTDPTGRPKPFHALSVGGYEGRWVLVFALVPLLALGTAVGSGLVCTLVLGLA